MHPKLLQGQNVLKVKEDFFALDGMARHPQLRSWWRPASAVASDGRAAELSDEDRAWDKEAPQELCIHGVPRDDVLVLTYLSKALNGLAC